MSEATRPTRPTLADTANLPPMIDLPTAARYLGIGRTTAYALAARGALPVPVLRIGTALRVPTAPLLKILGITGPETPDVADTATASGTADPAADTENAALPAYGPYGREDPPRPALRYPAKWSVDQPRGR
jgi:NAD(P)-dependent dehydrogenase (short-subunit alcohol dehydrogenase family)